MISQVSVYKTEDGQLFEDRTKAIEHEIEYAQKKLLTTFCEEYMYNGTDCCDVADVLFEYQEQLLEALKPVLCMKRKEIK